MKRRTMQLVLGVFLLWSIGASGENEIGGGNNDGLDAKGVSKNKQLFSPAGPEVARRMPPELKEIQLEPGCIEIISDDYNMGDWQESPSKIIYHDGWYHMWIIDIPQQGRKAPKGKSVTSHLKSEDGKVWYDQGRLPLGEKGSIDDAQRLAPDVVKHKGKFYLFYEPMTTNTEKYRQRRCGIAALVADQPEGPWTYAHEGLLLTPDIDDPDAWDHLFVANPRIEHFNGKWYMYYKALKKKGERTRNGVAVSDNLLGPYKKYEGNPLMIGHSANLVKYKGGLIYMNYHGHAFYWTQDGFHFVKIKDFGKDKERFKRMNWSTFFIPENPLYGGDPSRPAPEKLWGVSSRWAPKRFGKHNNDIIGAKLVIGEK